MDINNKLNLNYKKFASIAIFIFILLYFSMATFAADHTVTNTKFSDVKNSIDTSTPGDQILLGNKTYSSDSVSEIIVNKDNIVIRGQSSGSKAILDGSGSGSRILYISGDNVRLENIIFKK